MEENVEIKDKPKKKTIAVEVLTHKRLMNEKQYGETADGTINRLIDNMQ